MTYFEGATAAKDGSKPLNKEENPSFFIADLNQYPLLNLKTNIKTCLKVRMKIYNLHYKVFDLKDSQETVEKKACTKEQKKKLSNFEEKKYLPLSSLNFKNNIRLTLDKNNSICEEWIKR